MELTPVKLHLKTTGNLEKHTVGCHECKLLRWVVGYFLRIIYLAIALMM